MKYINNMTDLFAHEMQDLYSAEQQLVKALTKMANFAVTPEVKVAFERHLKQTIEQSKRLEQICSGLGISPGKMTCKGMKGIIEEGSELVKESSDSSEVRDAALIAAAQRAEHYEISGYGTAACHAALLRNSRAEQLLNRTLSEEKETDKELTELAMSFVNDRSLSDTQEG